MRAALITGGSSGIGLAIARMLRDEGFELTLSARTPEKLEAAAVELGAHTVIANVAEEEDCERLVREHAERFGRLDVLVNSAGVGLGGPIEQMSTKKWDLQLDVNLRGTFIVTRESTRCCVSHAGSSSISPRSQAPFPFRCWQRTARPRPA